jgi:hypothetical protein
MRFSKVYHTFLFLDKMLTLLYMQMLTIEVIVFLCSEIAMKCQQTWFMVQTKPIHILQAHVILK